MKRKLNFDSLTLEQKIGQLLFIGFPGTELDSPTTDLLQQIQPGGVIIFGRNVASASQLRALLEATQAHIEQPALFGIDQEGGLVDRLRRIVTPMPAARVIRQHGDLAAARQLGRITGELLLTLGFNINFAPAVEILNETRDLLQNGLYSRAFGRSPGEVFGYTTVYLHGLQNTGCLGCAKHFPGIGAGEVDSHEAMPIIRLTHDDLIAMDLAPYIEMFHHEPPFVHCVMVGHGGFPNLAFTRGVQKTTNEKLIPASLNYEIVTNLLRDELGYRGLAITDDLEMGAVGKNYKIEEAVEMAVVAGQDMLLVCAEADLIHRAYNHLLSAVKNNRIPLERIDEAVNRIKSIKSLIPAASKFNKSKISQLSDEVASLNYKLNYTYGGKL